MKTLRITFLLSLLLLPSVVLAEADYKCFVSLSSADPWITGTFANSPADAKAQLKHRIIQVNKRRLRINHIYECVKVDFSFTNKQAQALEQTMRF